MKNKVFKKFKIDIIETILVGIVIASSVLCVNEFKKIKIESAIDYFEKRADFDSEQVKIGKELFKKYKNISDYNYNMTLASLNYLPEKLLSTLKDSGLEGVIASCSALEYNNDLGLELNTEERLNVKAKNIDAYYSPLHHIFVSAKLDDLFNFELNLVHEIGHAFDYLNFSTTNKILSQQDEFMAIYNSSEKDTLFDYNDYFTRSEKEYFAESFSLYYINPTYLKNKAPNTYKYLKNTLSQYES